MMQRRQLIGLVIAPCLFGGTAWAPARAAVGDAQALLVSSDAVRNPSQPYRVTVTLTEFEKGKQVDTSTLVSYARILEASGQFVTLLRFMQPARDAGKLMLMNGKDLWVFDAGTKASIRISPQQRLLGNASNGDVVTVNYARDYGATLTGEESITDGERQTRKCYHLTLAAANEEANYPSIEIWLDVETRAPVKAKFFSDSGQLLKTVYYRRFQSQLGANRPTELVIIDGLNPQSVTIIRFSEFAARNIPALWFQRDYLPRFQGE